VNQGNAIDVEFTGRRHELVEPMNPMEWLQELVADISDADVAAAAVSILSSATIVSVLQTIFG
jgi:hypothetical protein